MGRPFLFYRPTCFCGQKIFCVWNYYFRWADRVRGVGAGWGILEFAEVGR